jgi:hypothetical protein
MRVLNSIDSFVASNENETFGEKSLLEHSNSFYFSSLGSLFSWSLNILLVLLVLAKLYVNGEPRVDEATLNKCENSVWLNYKQAGQSFEARNYEDAMIDLEQCLQELGQSIPKTRFQLANGIVWQLIRMALDKIYLGVFLSRLSLWYFNIKVNVLDDFNRIPD